MPINLTAVQDTNANDAINVGVIAGVTGPRYLRQIINTIETATLSTSTAWTLGTTFGDYGGFRAGSILKITYTYPTRNDGTSWGGIYFEPQIRYNAGTWFSLGSRGHDEMAIGGGLIGHMSNTFYLDPAQVADFSIGLRYYYRAYESTIILNGSHEINNISGTAKLMSGNNGNQHYGNWIIEELASLKG